MRSHQRFEALGDRFATIAELFQMLASGGRWWAIPAFVVLILLSIVFVVLHAMPYVAPFIYTVF